MNTPVGEENRLVQAGISLPALVDAGMMKDEKESLNHEMIHQYYAEDSKDKIFGADSQIEIRKEPTLPWYYPGFFRVIAACVALVAGTWLVGRILFIW